MIIDANVHITENGSWFQTGNEASVSALIAQMDAAQVDKAVLVPFQGIMSNEFCRTMVSKYPNRFVQALSLNITAYNDHDGLERALGELFTTYEAPVIKFHNRLHNYLLTDERFLKALDVLSGLKNKPLVFICGVINDKNLVHDQLPPFVFRNIVSKYPQLNFVIMHACGSYALQAYELLKEYTNVYFDLSFVMNKFRGSSVTDDLRFLIQNFDRRLIFGSDFPEYSIPDALGVFNELAEGLENAKRENILSGNLQRLLYES